MRSTLPLQTLAVLLVLATVLGAEDLPEDHLTEDRLTEVGALAQQGLLLLDRGVLRDDTRLQTQAAALLRQSLALATVLAASLPGDHPGWPRLRLTLEEVRQALRWLEQLEAEDSDPPPSEDGEVDTLAFEELVAARLLTEARRFEATYPEEPRPALDRYLVVTREHPGTAAAMAAQEAVARLEALLAAPRAPVERDVDPRPRWRQLEERLRELEPDEVAQVREDVRQLLGQRHFLEAFDRVRRAHEAARRPRTRALLSTVLADLRQALETISFALLGGQHLVGRSHVFRLASGHTMGGEVQAFDGTTFRVTQAEGASFELPLLSLSPLGLAQIATTGNQGAEPYLSAAYLFMLLEELPHMDRYLELAQRRGADTANLEATASITREISVLRKELPAARAAWRRTERAVEQFFRHMRRRSYLPALRGLKAALPDIHALDLRALDELAHERMRVGLAALLEEARTSCTAVHVDVERNLIPCDTCEGDGIVNRLRDPAHPDRVKVTALRCPDCDGTGTVQCPLCRERFLDPELRALQEQVARLTPP